MPTYEYQCNKCDEEFELRRKRLDPTPVVCPACGKEDCKKLISASSFHLKGGGWFDEGYGLNDAAPKKASKDDEKSVKKDDPTDSESSPTESVKESKPAKDSGKGASEEKKTAPAPKKTPKTKKSDD